MQSRTGFRCFLVLFLCCACDGFTDGRGANESRLAGESRNEGRHDYDVPHPTLATQSPAPWGTQPGAPSVDAAVTESGLRRPDTTDAAFDASGETAPTDSGPAVALPSPRFIDIAADLGLQDYAGSTGEPYEHQHGPGGVFTDLNDDGFPDLFLVHNGVSRLFENISARGDRTLRELDFDGVPRPSSGAIAADYDNDGDIDLFLVCYGGGNVLYQNQYIESGTLTFTDVTASTDPTPLTEDPQHGLGIAEHNDELLARSLTAAWADVNRDGRLDLYVGHHRGTSHLVDPPRAGERDTLYLGREDGAFVDSTTLHGIGGWESQSGETVTETREFSSTNAVAFADLNNDLWPDLIVTNKYNDPLDSDMIYVNLGANSDGDWLGFRMISYDFPSDFGKSSPLAMGIAVADPDHDGDLDLYVSDFGPSDFYRNSWSDTGTLSFTRDDCCEAQRAWGVRWEDFDNNGDEDLHVASASVLGSGLYAATTNDVATSWGLDLRGAARATLSADWNRDGFRDLFVVYLRAPPQLLVNPGLARWSGNGLSLHLVGSDTPNGNYRSTRDAIGARVNLRVIVDGQARELRRDVASGNGTAASTSSLSLHFGTSSSTTVQLEVLWPSGRTSSYPSLETGRHLTIVEPGGATQ